ncbi:MAG: PAS domain S-box protein, partial [Anaerolineae bacterium]|nr:PAS domain S-box protein [Anaerolineae bacterium]
MNPEKLIPLLPYLISAVSVIGIGLFIFLRGNFNFQLSYYHQQAILNHLSDAIMVLNHRREIIYTNAAMAAILQAAVAPANVKSAESSLAKLKPLHEILQKPCPAHEEISFLHQGKLCRYEVTYAALHNNKKAPRGYFVTLCDITETNNLRSEQSEIEGRYQALFQHANDGVFILDLDGKHILVNQRAADMLGYPVDELIGKHIAEMVAPHEITEAMEHYHAILAKKALPVYERTFRKKDGTFLSTEINATLVLDNGGRPKHIQSIVRDITERKRSEAYLIDSEKRYRNLVEDMPALICRFLSDGTLVFVNQAYCKAFAKTSAELLGFNFFEFIPPEEIQQAKAHLASLNPVTPVKTYEHKVIAPDGEIRWQQWIDRAFFNQHGETIEYQSIGLDISHRIKTEQRLHQAQKVAEAASQAKSTFLAHMSHELRTPLNAILGYNELLALEPNLTHQQADIIQIINRSGEHLLALVNDILDFSKIEAGSVELQNETFRLPELLANLAEMFRLPIEEKNIELSFELPDDLPQFIRADRRKLRQILINLMSNAIKFTTRGKITLIVQRQPAPGPLDEDSLELEFALQDTGSGIPEDQLENIFNPFFQNTSENADVGGVGLGLPISREYAHLMGGELTVSSELGTGSIFRFTIFAKGNLGPGKLPGNYRPGKRRARLADNQPLYRVLVVEDVESNRNLLKRILEPLGFDLQEAHNGLQAVEVVKNWQPDLIFMDIRMPEMDGLRAIGEINKLPNREKIKFVALTASSFEEDRSKILQAGYDGFIPKPFRRKQIIDALEQHLSVKFEEQSIDSAKEYNILAPSFPALA